MHIAFDYQLLSVVTVKFVNGISTDYTRKYTYVRTYETFAYAVAVVPEWMPILNESLEINFPNENGVELKVKMNLADRLFTPREYSSIHIVYTMNRKKEAPALLLRVGVLLYP